MRKRNPTRKNLDLSQQELAAYLGVSRSVISMYERGERELPTAALIKLAELEMALGKLTRSKKALPRTAVPDRASCRKLLQTHLADCDWKLQGLQRQLKVLEASHQQLHSRAQVLQVMQACSGPGCNKREATWLELQCHVNEHELSCLQPGQVYMLQHKVSMLQLEIAATEKAMGRL